MCVCISITCKASTLMQRPIQTARARSVPPEAVVALAEGWGALHTLDLYNVGAAEMPAEVGEACWEHCV